MPMIPITFALAAAALLVLAWEIRLTEHGSRNIYFLIFLGLLAFLLVLIGARFGYGIERLIILQPIIYALTLPFAYLSFSNPRIDSGSIWKLAAHLTPLLVVLTLMFAIELIDIFLGLTALIYAGLLARLGMRGQDALPWADVNRISFFRNALWATVLLLFVSGCTDLAIAADFWSTGGSNTGSIAGKSNLITLTTLIIVVAIVSVVQFLKSRKTTATKQELTNVDDEAKSSEQNTLAELEALMHGSQLYLDPNLNLNRVARKIGVPARQVSQAINRQLELGFSQFINNMRIDEACNQLKQTNHSITQIMLQTGFNTKSNFNREFNRRTGKSPSEWRKLNS